MTTRFLTHAALFIALLAAVPHTLLAQDDNGQTVTGAAQSAAAQPEPVENSPYRAYFEPEDIEPLLGEPVNVTLVVNVPASSQVEFPAFERDWGDFTVVGLDEVAIADTAEGTTYTLPMQIIPWGTGLVETPDTRVRVLGAGVDEQVRVESFLFEVPTMLDENPVLRVSRTVFRLPYPLAFWGGIAGAVVLLVGLPGTVIFLRSSAHRMRQRRQRVVPRTLTQRTMNRLNQIRSEAPDIAIQYAAMGDTLRVFIRDLYDMPAPDLTTLELMELLELESRLPDEKQRSLGFLLEQADLAKFAPSEIYAPSDLSMLKVAMLWVQDVGKEAAE
ncbi:MAG: hypothetical protein AAF787_12410 [Chloroflexota bacterium]